jgi:hypothetical protein
VNSRYRLTAFAMLLSGCGQTPEQATSPEAAGLEAAAVERGLVDNASDAPLTGVFASGGGRVCMLESGSRIGVVSQNGEGGRCAASGTFERRGGGLRVGLGDCRFEAGYDGEHIVFPGDMPEACNRLCTEAASLADLNVDRLSDSPAEAAALRDDRDRTLCPTTS